MIEHRIIASQIFFLFSLCFYDTNFILKVSVGSVIFSILLQNFILFDS